MGSLNKGAAIVIGCFVLAVVFLAPPVIHGDEWNLKTRFTVSHQFEVPGMVLQANTPYVIKLVDSPSNRNVVQIYNNDENKMLTMFMAISDLRLEPTDRTQFTFIETAPGFPLPIKEWFYPGRLSGLEFVYPKDQAKAMASHSRESILTAEAKDLGDLSRQAPIAESTANITKTETTTVVQEKPSVTESAPTEPVVEQEQQVVEQQNVEQQNVEQPAPIVEQAQTDVDREKPSETAAIAEKPAVQENELPATAGELPMIALIGALCLGAGLGLKILSAKS